MKQWLKILLYSLIGILLLYITSIVIKTNRAFNQSEPESVSIDTAFYRESIYKVFQEKVEITNSFSIQDIDTIIQFNTKNYIGSLWIISDVKLQELNNENFKNTPSLEKQNGTFVNYSINPPTTRLTYRKKRNSRPIELIIYNKYRSREAKSYG